MPLWMSSQMWTHHETEPSSYTSYTSYFSSTSCHTGLHARTDTVRQLTSMYNKWLKKLVCLSCITGSPFGSSCQRISSLPKVCKVSDMQFVQDIGRRHTIFLIWGLHWSVGCTRSCHHAIIISCHPHIFSHYTPCKPLYHWRRHAVSCWSIGKESVNALISDFRKVYHCHQEYTCKYFQTEC